MVLASPNKVSTGLNSLGYHVIDESVLVVNTYSLHLILVFGLVDSFESVLEEAVVLLQNSVFRRELQGQLSVNSVLHTGVHETLNGGFSVEHSQVSSFALEVVKLLLNGSTTVIWNESNKSLTWLVNNIVLTPILICISVSTHDNRLGPSRNESGDVGANDGLSEDSTVEDVSNCSIGRPPHLFQVEFCDSVLVGSDGCAFDTTLCFGDGICSINGDLIVGSISAFH